MAHSAHDKHASDHGTMDITDQVKTWLGFWAGVKWSVVSLVVLAILLAIFRTN